MEKISKNNNLFFKLQNNGSIFYVEIIKKTNAIKFEIIKKDKLVQKYSLVYDIAHFHNHHSYFKNFKNVDDLFDFNFKKLKNEEIFINQKNEEEILFKIIVAYIKKKEEIKFVIKKTDRINVEFSYENKKDEKWKDQKSKIETTKKNGKFIIIKKINKLKAFPLLKLFPIFLFIITIYHLKKNQNTTMFSRVKKKYKRLISKSLNEDKKYIIFMDRYNNEYTNANDAFPIFDYYRKKGRKDAYYFLLENSQLHLKLLKENNLNNTIVIKMYGEISGEEIYTKTFYYILHSKLIVFTYRSKFLDDIMKLTNYNIKSIYLDHGCPVFKETLFLDYFNTKIISRAIVKTKPEWNTWLKHGWNESQLYKGALARWERFNHIQNKKNAILIFFTWRQISKGEYYNSTFYKKIDEIFRNKNFIKYLKSKKIKIYYKRHHNELVITGGIHKYNNTYIYEVTTNDNFSKIIDDSSLLITDYSGLSMDFIFQNKPVIFYLIDKDDPKIGWRDQYNMKNITQKMIYGNLYNNLNEVINKVRFYVENNFTLEKKLKDKYESLFYFKKDILVNIENVFDRVISEK